MSNTKPFLGFYAGELRTAKGADGSYTITGLAAPYEKWSNVLYGFFRERFLRGAFRESIDSGSDIICTLNHNPLYMMGRRSSSTLTVKDTEDGVYIENKVPNTSYSNDLIVSIDRKDIRGMSFIFDTDYKDEIWDYGADKVAQRTIKKAKIMEVTYTAVPAYEDTSLDYRSLGIRNIDEMKALHKTLTDKKFPLAPNIEKLKRLGINI